MKKLSLLFSFFYLMACSPSPTPCTYGEPTAIFDNNISGIKDHRFKASGQNGTETMQFDLGFGLEIYQKGCDDLSQEFRFTIPGKSVEKDPTYWIKQTTMLFHTLGDLSEKHLIYHQYAKVLEDNATLIHLGEAFSIGQGINIKLDHIRGAEQNILTVLISQQ